MSKFNKADRKIFGVSPITTSENPTGKTHEGGAGYSRDVKSDLFLLGVSNFVGEKDFYESAQERDARYKTLVRDATMLDPEWTAKFLGWLRNDANMRSASLVGAAEFTRARLDNKLSGLSRQVIRSVIQRADEPGEMLAYWTENYGRNIPKPVKRGVADACTRLINEYSYHKYNTDKGFGIGDVIELTHPSPKDAAQSELFSYAANMTHGLAWDYDDSLMPMTAWRRTFYDNARVDPSVILNQTMVRQAGLTWENVLSLAGDKLPKNQVWESVIPSMGYMALLRNLRNFDESYLNRTVADSVIKRLTDPEQVAKSRQLPFRFLSAYKEVGNNARWAYALEQALDLSIQNIPVFKGTTLILVDTSGSMDTPLTNKTQMRRVEAAALFGAALCRQNRDSRLFGFASGIFPHVVYPANSILSTTKEFIQRVGEVGYGTQVWYNVQQAINYYGAKNIARVIVLSDEQSADSADRNGFPADLPLYFFNLGGYAKSTVPSAGNKARYNFGGLTDHTFKMIPLLERGRSASWPWEEN